MIVGDQQSLNEAVAAGAAEILIEPGTYSLRLFRKSGISFKPRSPRRPPTFSTVLLNGCEDLEFRGLRSDGGNAASFTANNCTNVAVVDYQFRGPATQFRDGSTSLRAHEGLVFRNCDRCGVRDSLIEGHDHGAVFRDCTRGFFSRNEVTRMIGDGLRLCGVQDQVVLDNFFHAWLGSTHKVNHDDMIQVFSEGATLLTKRLLISGNDLDSTDGPATQGIFVRNEQGERTGELYEDITIVGNNVHNGHEHGIYVSGATSYWIRENVLTHDADAFMIPIRGATPANSAPRITVIGGEGLVEGNLAA